MTTPLISFYGDDFTGSSAAMEVLSFAGVNTAMFLEPPSAQDLAEHPDLAAIGIAGVARSRPPHWMEEHLPAVFHAMAQFGAPISHYKTCSTFDSSPSCGSIGKAIDIAAPLLGGVWHPLVVGAPELKRYQAFGQLFAGISNKVYRLDRHPVMSKHPSTPMHEADVLRHLSLQTQRALALVDLAEIKAGTTDRAIAERLKQGAEVIAIDVIDQETLAEAGRCIWNDGRAPVFAVGSQGVEYALVAHWRAMGLLPRHFTPPTLQPVEQIFCVSGSCSAINEEQLADAESNGFIVLALDPALAVDPQAWSQEIDRLMQSSLASMAAGQDVIVATARGPNDASILRLRRALRETGASSTEVNDRIGQGLGTLVAEVRRQTSITRVIVAGGDTSGHTITALGVKSLTTVAPLVSGAPLCRINAHSALMDGMEVALKGGQMGAPDFFSRAKYGVS